MKNFLKYFFSILLMLSCLILFSMLAYKALFLDKDKAPEASVPEGNIKNEEQAKPEAEDKPEEQAKPEDKEIKPEDAPFAAADASYFSDALFIGDSRTMGLSEYGRIEGASFFANTGMSVYNVREKKVNVAGAGEVSLEQLLDSKDYGKIYLMLGINELGYDMDQTVRKYKELVDWICEKNPDGLLFIQGNLHVAAARSDKDKYFNNNRINELNGRISQFIDNKKIFYIDANKLFDDEKGNLKAEYTSDNTHIFAKYYPDWTDWLLTKAIIPDSEA